MLILEGDGKRRTREWDERRALNHHLANLVAFSYHEPRKMPSFEPSSAAPKKANPEQDLALVRGYLKGLSLRGRKKV